MLKDFEIITNKRVRNYDKLLMPKVRLAVLLGHSVQPPIVHHLRDGARCMSRGNKQKFSQVYLNILLVLYVGLKAYLTY